MKTRPQSCCAIDCHHSLAAHPVGLQSVEDFDSGLRKPKKKHQKNTKTTLQRQKKSTKARNTPRHRSRLPSTSRNTHQRRSLCKDRSGRDWNERGHRQWSISSHRLSTHGRRGIRMNADIINGLSSSHRLSILGRGGIRMNAGFVNGSVK
jgi:hypothetical protein